MTPDLKVLFAPDWSDGVAYQRLLADALAAHRAEVSFLQGYKRALPLWRLCQEQNFDILHLHWPEAYFPRKDDRFDRARTARFWADLALATRNRGLVVTAHNLHAHNRGDEPLVKFNHGVAFRHAGAVIAHSEASRSLLVETFRVEPECIHVIPHGDLSTTFPPLPSRTEARQHLRLDSRPVCLIFGMVEKYKGIEEALEYWKTARPGVRLAIVGKPHCPEYGNSISRAASGVPNVHLDLKRQTDEELALWLGAADCVLFNYRTILTSGAACLTRSLGIPLLLPSRIQTVDLAEPDPRVIRFDAFNSDFALKLLTAVKQGTSHESASNWRDQTSWARVAQLTAEVYRTALR